MAAITTITRGMIEMCYKNDETSRRLSLSLSNPFANVGYGEDSNGDLPA